MYTQVGELHVSSIMSTQFLSNVFFPGTKMCTMREIGLHKLFNITISKKRGKNNNNRELALVDHECLTLKSNVNCGLELLHRDMREIPSPIFGTPCV